MAATAGEQSAESIRPEFQLTLIYGICVFVFENRVFIIFTLSVQCLYCLQKKKTFYNLIQEIEESLVLQNSMCIST